MTEDSMTSTPLIGMAETVIAVVFMAENSLQIFTSSGFLNFCCEIQHA